MEIRRKRRRESDFSKTFNQRYSGKYWWPLNSKKYRKSWNERNNGISFIKYTILQVASNVIVSLNKMYPLTGKKRVKRNDDIKKKVNEIKKQSESKS